MNPKTASASTDQTLEIYKLMVEMADRVSQRRQTANSFYLSVSTLLIGGSAYLKSLGIEGVSAGLVPIAGIAISILWIRAISSYTALNDAKFSVINALEDRLPVQPYNDEWKLLNPPEDPSLGKAKLKKYRPFHRVEVWIPWLFIGLYAAQMVIALAASDKSTAFVSGACPLLVGDFCQHIDFTSD